MQFNLKQSRDSAVFTQNIEEEIAQMCTFIFQDASYWGTVKERRLVLSLHTVDVARWTFVAPRQ